MKFLILHGSFGSKNGNWFPQLKEKLELLNQQVVLEQLPVDNLDEMVKQKDKYGPTKQNLNSWLKAFKTLIYPQVKNETIIVVAHSMGPLFFLHVMEHFPLKIDSAIFVSPFLSLPQNSKYWPINLVNKSFYKTDFDFSVLRKKIPLSYVLYSDNDPYVPITQALKFADSLGSAKIPVLGGQHLNAEVNLNEFPLVFELCKSRIKLTLYQKYLAFLSEYHPSELVRKGVGRALLMPASELTKEGVFHFNHLQKGGFCTLPINQLDYWQVKQSDYMKASRQAAKRVPIERVYILNTIEELNKPGVKIMMKADKQAGIKVFYCLKKDLPNLPELDFGIWDKEYVCTVKHDNNNTNFELDSRQNTLNQVNNWRQKILAIAKPF